MAWTVPVPQDTWKERDTASFLREIHTRLRFGSFSWNPPSVASATAVDTTLTSTDDARLGVLRAGMWIDVCPPSGGITSGLVVEEAWVPADGSLTIRLYNATGSPIDEASGTWSFVGVIV